MPGERAEHVVEEADSRGHVGAARAVEVDLEVDLGLLGLAVQGGRAAHGRASVVSVTEVSASLNAAISGAVPMETRSQPSGPVSRISTPRSSNPCQTACLSGKCPNSAKLASLSATVKPRPRKHPTGGPPARPPTPRSCGGGRAGGRPPRAARRRGGGPPVPPPGSPPKGGRADVRRGA